jgi:hypothetical protein
MITRRRLLVLSGGALLAAGCSRSKAAPAACDDAPSLASLKDDERATRATMAYADHAPAPERTCEHCNQWVAASERSSCGTCKLLKGPIHPDGTCKAFTAKT